MGKSAKIETIGRIESLCALVISEDPGTSQYDACIRNKDHYYLRLFAESGYILGLQPLVSLTQLALRNGDWSLVRYFLRNYHFTDKGEMWQC
jgi:hypothetical protein